MGQSARTSEDLCPFCRASEPEDHAEILKQIRIRIDQYNDTVAMNQLGAMYENGGYGLTKSRQKAEELFKRSYDFGSPDAALQLAHFYPDKMLEYIEEAARRGNIHAEYLLGIYVYQSEDFEKSIGHLIKVTRAGSDVCMKELMSVYRRGILSKDDLASTLRAYQAAVDETKSETREYAKRFKRYIQSCASSPTSRVRSSVM